MAIETKVRKMKTGADLDGLFVTFYLPKNERVNDFTRLKGKSIDGYVLTLKKPQKKTRNMHNYMWVLCDEIAKKMSAKSFDTYTKEDVYRNAIREVGKWQDYEVPTEAVKDLITGWIHNGLGWLVEVIVSDKSTTQVRLYQGASTYSGEDLYRLTNYVVDEAKELGIETITESELKHLEELWEKR